MELFVNTLKKLASQSEALKQQTDAVLAMQETLKAIASTSGILPADASYEVHLQAYDDDHTPIKTSGPSLNRARSEAIAFWTIRNKFSKEPRHPRAEVFVQKGKHLVALSPEDAAQIANAESASVTFKADQFTLDERLMREVGKIVWGSGESLPGWHSRFITSMSE